MAANDRVAGQVCGSSPGGKVSGMKNDAAENNTRGTPENGFRVDCNARRTGKFCVCTESLSVKIGQRFKTDGSVGLQAWDSVLVSCERAGDGALDIQILLFHPDWDEPRQLALIKARPNNHGMDFPILSINFGDNCATAT